MNGYPDGCSQSDHDRAFGELGNPPDVDVVRLDCGHYDTEDRGEQVGGKLVCPRCFDERTKTVKAVVSPLSKPIGKAGIVSIGPGLFVRTGRRRK